VKVGVAMAICSNTF